MIFPDARHAHGPSLIVHRADPAVRKLGDSIHVRYQPWSDSEKHRVMFNVFLALTPQEQLLTPQA